MRAILVALLLLLPAACAQRPDGPQSAAAPLAGDPTDPFEATNRRLFVLNTAIDDCCLRPIAVGYRHALHPWVRTRIRNVVNNAQELRHSANAALQGEPLVAGENLMRFVINTTLGLGGMFDLESVGGPPSQPRDFGQTLYRWGVEDGPFLMLPVVGPSNPRDLLGRVADGFMNPVSWLMPFTGNLARGVVEGIDLREQNVESLDALRSESLDFYARFRSVWQQRRSAQLGRTTPDDPGSLDVLDDPAAAPGTLIPSTFRAPVPSAGSPQLALSGNWPTPSPSAPTFRPVAYPIWRVVPMADRRPAPGTRRLRGQGATGGSDGPAPNAARRRIAQPAVAAGQGSPRRNADRQSRGSNRLTDPAAQRFRPAVIARPMRLATDASVTPRPGEGPGHAPGPIPPARPLPGG
jgi:phospholipid-binding lipoprotein MlaA